jgi:hypothetical protein
MSDHTWVDDLEKNLHVYALEHEVASLKARIAEMEAGPTPPTEEELAAEQAEREAHEARWKAEQEAKRQAIEAKKARQVAKLQALCDKLGFTVTVSAGKHRPRWGFVFYFTTPEGRRVSYDLGYRGAYTWIESPAEIYGLARELTPRTEDVA